MVNIFWRDSGCGRSRRLAALVRSIRIACPRCGVIGSDPAPDEDAL